MKTSLNLLASVSVLAVALAGTTGCDRNDHNGSPPDSGRTAGQQLDDKTLEGNVKAALAADAVKYPEVKVTAYKGVVQLSGFVNESDQKSRAGDLAGKVTGVSKVENNITVKSAKNP